MTLTFEFQIRSACRAGSVLQRKMKSTSDQNLVLEVLQKDIMNFRQELSLVKGNVTFFTLSKLNIVLVCTWVVWNDLSCVLSTATGAVAGVGPKAPWNNEIKTLPFSKKYLYLIKGENRLPRGE